MNKVEFVAALAEKTGSTKTQAQDFLNAFTETVEEVLVSGDKVALIGFGTFETRERAASIRTNPRDPKGEKLNVPATRAAAFKVGASLKKAVKN